MASGQEHVGSGRRNRRNRQKEPPRLFWVALAAPGVIWLALLFIVPFYAILAIAGGQLDLFGVPFPVWNPLNWRTANFSAAWHDVAGSSAFVGAGALALSGAVAEVAPGATATAAIGEDGTTSALFTGADAGGGTGAGDMAASDAGWLAGVDESCAGAGAEAGAVCACAAGTSSRRGADGAWLPPSTGYRGEPT